jgi:hypothetical protein
MPLEATIRIKISSEAAEAVALTPVVVTEMPLAEFMEHLAAATSANAEHARDLLKRGTLVSGASRFRWQPVECSLEEVEAAFQRLPEPDPSRLFDPSKCRSVVLIAGARRWEISRTAAAERRFLRTRSFWAGLVAALPAPLYVTYLHKERADLYRSDVGDSARQSLQSAAPLLRYGKLAAELKSARLTSVEWIVPR